MPINQKVQALKKLGYNTITFLTKSLGKNIKPAEISTYFLQELHGISIKNRTYYSKKDLEKIKEYILNIPREEKIKQTKLKKYNNLNNTEKIKETLKNKYGVENISQLEEIKKKKEETCLKKYGKKYFLQTEEGKEKIKQTCLNRYGVKNYSSTDEFKARYKKTCLDRYGLDSTNKLEKVQKKKEETCLKKYGIKYACLLNKKAFYSFDNIIFDSSWELAYYIWLKDKNINFIYHPTDKEFKYLDNNGKERQYYPDFKVLNEYVEIKGNQFFKNGEFISPYSNKEEKLKAKNKYNCMIENNVKILKKEDLKDVLKYAKNKFGNLKQFKR